MCLLRGHLVVAVGDRARCGLHACHHRLVGARDDIAKTDKLIDQRFILAVAALLFAGMIYFRTMSELSTMTTTSREALVVFAENVEGVNDALEKMRGALDTQKTLVGQNETLINELVGLRDIISRSNETMMTGMESTTSSIASSNDQMASSITAGIANELGAQTNRMVKELNDLSKTNAKALDQMTKSLSDTKNMDVLATNQKTIVRLLGDLSVQNSELQKMFSEKDNRVSYPRPTHREE